MSQQLVLDRELDDAKQMARILYLVHGACLVLSLGMLSFLPLIFNYIKRGETAGTMVQTHHSWMIRSFWYYVLWVVIGWILIFSIIGLLFAWAVFPLAIVWKAYRLIRGFLDLNNNKAMPI
ncbi:hypothetical protein G4G28_11140 [Massilia sp. Dwa41.01b]|uniref:DUF4870 family protein n=1 Tax=unclassified Massilia TaxID=2609279 RepID=UPI0016042113|nr:MULTISPECIES: hypothetical protein [unclassified Massilia]QNA88903.1 hypothetical protein G4G28_11140 [Massilia sp. Dwa41.01b]QNA99793.1 hypothetical protein G4G31_14770 [Massilia sp. Se16.2.3]